MDKADAPVQRTLGLLGATGVGVGAIVGGGILALAGVAFAATGPSAILAFAFNGLIAVLTALSFAEMAAAFPESGGTYTFAKKVLSVETAFMVGWVVWFASIVAAVLYALGFGAFGVTMAEELYRTLGDVPPAWLHQRWTVTGLAVAATLLYTVTLTLRSAGGGQWANVGKVLVFLVLIVGGIVVMAGSPRAAMTERLTPFFAFGPAGLFQAMGYTFIALQGFDLIAAVGGEVRDPGRTMPRAMLLSLAVALLIYIPLLLVLVTVGLPAGTSVVEAGERYPETLVAVAARTYLGTWGYWLVLVAAILSMLSALLANLLAASRIAFAMARDRTLPERFSALSQRHGTPRNAVAVTSAVVLTILLLIRDVAAAGAVSSLIFLLLFALAQGINMLMRHRGGTRETPFRVPFFPWIPSIGALACALLALFQGYSVPTAGVIAAAWLGLGGVLYFTFFADRAGVVDASAEALDPQLVRLRGRNPLVLVPIANPASARGLVEVANALAPTEMGRVLLLSVVVPPEQWKVDEAPRQLVDAQTILGESLTASFAAGLAPEALTTVARRPWQEIERVSREHGCESVLLGFGQLTEELMGGELETLLSRMPGHVVLLRAAPGFRLAKVRRVLIPTGGRRDQSHLRARLVGSLCRADPREISYLCVFGEDASQELCDRTYRDVLELAQDEAPGLSQVHRVRSASVADEIVRQAGEHDLVLLGLQRMSARRKVFGEMALRVARETTCPLLMISQRG